MTLQIRALYPVYSTGSAITHICLSLCRYMRCADLDVEILFPASDPDGREEFSRDALPGWLKRVAYKLDPGASRIRRYTEKKFLSRLQKGDVAYLWPGLSPELYQEVRSRGVLVVNERINTHRRTAKRILDEAYRRLGRAPRHGITDEACREETAKLQLCDYVFAPSPWVAKSLVDAGIPEDRILLSSYGWDPVRLGREGTGLDKKPGVTGLFVGRACVRKGVDFLMNAWAAAGVQGRLVVMGAMDPDIAEISAAQLRRDDITHLPYSKNVAPIYKSADLFLFPSLEEGSPLVLYEAMASGLACIISPMAAGEIGRPGIDCLVADPLDRDAWVEAIRRLAGDEGARRKLGEQARLRAQEFTWEKVALRRRAQLLEASRRSVSAP